MEDKQTNDAPKPDKAPVKAEKIDPILDEAEEEEDLDEFDEGGSFRENLAQIFRSIGLRSGGIFGCLTLLIIIAFSVYIFAFGGFGGWTGIKNYIPFLQTPAAPTYSLDKVKISHADTMTAYIFGFYRTNPTRPQPPSLELAYMFGGITPTGIFRFTSTQSGLETAYRIGFRGQPLERLSLYVANIMEIQNILNTDVNAILDASRNRKASLDGIIQSFDNLEVRSTQNAAFVKQEVLTATSLTRAQQSKLTQLERTFNTNLSQFLAVQSARDLEEYITTTKEYGETKARLGAMSKIDQYYQVGLVKLRARIHDIKANQDALIKGVKTFDIKNSDIKIIIYEGQPPTDPTINAIDRSKSTSTYTPLNLGVGTQP